MKKDYQEIIREFKKETGLLLEVKDNHLYYGGSLDLEGTGITSLPDGLTVGGSLDLEGTGITSLPDGLTVGGYLDLEGTGITDTSRVNRTLSNAARRKINLVKEAPKFWEWNRKKYICIDGIFSVVDYHRGNVYQVHQIGSTKTTYIVTDGDNHWAHGDTIQEARADLIFKINDRDTSAYKNLSLDDTLSYEEAIAAYRTITGACSAGTRDFIENRLPKPHKEEYTIREIIQLTKGEYRSDMFEGFFINNK